MSSIKKERVLELLRRGYREEARALAEKILAAKPRDAELWRLLGVIHGMSERSSDAERCFRQALRIDPHHLHARNNLATVLAAQNQPDEAIACCQQAIKSNPNFLPGYYNLARIMADGGRIEEAANWYEQALSRDLDVAKAKGVTFPRALVMHLCAIPPARWADKTDLIEEYGKALGKSKHFEREDRTLPEDMATQSLLTRYNPEQTTALVPALLDALAFTRVSTRDWNKKLFETLALPWMHQALTLGQYNLALLLETKIYDVYVKQTETDKHFRDCINRWAPAMREAGHRVSANLEAMTSTEVHSLPVVGFFLHSASMLAHVQLLLNLLEGLTKLDNKPLLPRVYVFSDDHPLIRERFTKLGVPVVFLTKSCGATEDNFYQKLVCLRRRCAADSVNAVVWVSNATIMPFAFAMRIAPVQIWWAMKYHSLELPDIDGYITSGSFARHVHINGRRWRSTRVQAPSHTSLDAVNRARFIRASFGNSILFGTLAREEKIDSPAFLDTVCRILKKHPNAIYLWTGRIALPSITERFKAAGVLDQTRYIGWVDTSVYCHVLDVFLDSFPAGCGLTVWETLSVGKPVVFLASDGQQEDISLDQLFWPLLQGDAEIKPESTAKARNIFNYGEESFYLRAADQDNYVAIASRLVEDEAWRQEVGGAGKRFVDEMMSDPSETAREFCGHVTEIMQMAVSRKD